MCRATSWTLASPQGYFHATQGASMSMARITDARTHSARESKLRFASFYSLTPWLWALRSLNSAFRSRIKTPLRFILFSHSIWIMMYFIHFLVTAAAIYFFAQSNLVEGITLSNGYVSALLFAVVLAVVNLILGTILRIVSLPLRIITLGLFSFVISVVIVYVTDQLVPSVTITGIIPLIIFSTILSVTSFVLKLFK